MIYAVSFNIAFDDNEIMSEEDLKNAIEYLLESAAVTVRDFKLLDVKD